MAKYFSQKIRTHATGETIIWGTTEICPNEKFLCWLQSEWKIFFSEVQKKLKTKFEISI